MQVFGKFRSVPGKVIVSLLLALPAFMSTASSHSSSAAREAGDRWAVANVSSAIMREAPDYESAAVSQMRMGVLVKVLGMDFVTEIYLHIGI